MCSRGPQRAAASLRDACRCFMASEGAGYTRGLHHGGFLFSHAAVTGGQEGDGLCWEEWCVCERCSPCVTPLIERCGGAVGSRSGMCGNERPEGDQDFYGECGVLSLHVCAYHVL